MQRRTFIGSSLLAGISSAYAADGSVMDTLHERFVSSGLLPTRPSQEYRQLVARFKRPAAAIALGERYLTDHPELQSMNRLLMASGIDGNESLLSSFENKTKRDFEKGNTVCIDGWVLSEAEVSLCALFALSTTLNTAPAI